MPTLTGILVSSETVMDTTAAPRRTDGLHVAAPDGCTLAESTAFQGFGSQTQYLELTNS